MPITQDAPSAQQLLEACDISPDEWQQLLKDANTRCAALAATKRAGRAKLWAYFTPVVGLSQGKPACRLQCSKCKEEYRSNNPTALYQEHILQSHCKALKIERSQALLAEELSSPSSKRTATDQGSNMEGSVFKQARLPSHSLSTLQQATRHLCRFFYHCPPLAEHRTAQGVWHSESHCYSLQHALCHCSLGGQECVGVRRSTARHHSHTCLQHFGIQQPTSKGYQGVHCM